ncbi:hypothetical protein [Alteromonas gracilis]|uniref:hypothetical protein n=1 Tax=Alteromonas gracilis TaxID=1479524 RepID=UPI003735B54F
MANEQLLLSVPTENASEKIEVSIIFNDGSTQSWAGEKIEKGYHLHVNAVYEEADKKCIRPFTGLRRFISPSDNCVQEEISSLDINASIISNLAFSVARASDLIITKEGARLMRSYSASNQAIKTALGTTNTIH